MLRCCSLGSGSEGNALVVEAFDGFTTTRVLVDDGFGQRELARRLHRAGLAVGDLDAVVVTHEHSDHIAGMRALVKKQRLRVYASAGTARAAGSGDQIEWHVLRSGETVAIGGIAVMPHAVPHDAAEPLQFVFSDGCRRLGLLTDIGAPTASVARSLDRLHALILECNHDSEMLAASDYPAFLKARIASDHGHLSNAQAAALLAGLDRSCLHFVAAAHLSRSNNRPEIARRALADVIGCGRDEIQVACQDRGLPWFTV